MKQKENLSNSEQKRALVMTLSYPSADPRPLRMIGFLQSNGYRVDLLSYPYNREPIQGINRHHEIPSPKYDLFSKVIRNLHGLSPVLSGWIPGKKLKEQLILSRFELASFSESLSDETYDLIVAQDLILLPIAFSMEKKAKVLFDAREYYPSQFEDQWFFRQFEKREREWLCSEYLSKCDALITVSPGLKRRYDDEYHVNFEIVRSVPDSIPLEVGDVSKEQIRMVHHGGAIRSRKIENMIKIAQQLGDRYSLDLYLTGEPGYLTELKEMLKTVRNVTIREPIAFDNIIPTLNRYDIGLYYLEPASFNLKYCLPNKLFEFIQARLMVSIGPSPDMADVVNHYGCGVVADEFSIESMVDSVSNQTRESIQQYKENSQKASTELCFEKEKEVLDSMIEKMIPVHE